jgi:hypothetical protein
LTKEALMLRNPKAVTMFALLTAGCFGAGTDPSESWTGALTDEDCAELTAACQGDDDGACHELTAACAEPNLDAAHRCAEMHDACAGDHADAVCGDVAVLCQVEHDGDADAEAHDGDADAHDADADAHDGDADADAHDGDADADAHDGDADAHDGDADAHDGDADADAHDGDADAHDGDADAGDGDAAGDADGHAGALACEGTHPIVDGDVRSCGEGDTYCVANDTCYADDIAAACCGAHG